MSHCKGCGKRLGDFEKHKCLRCNNSYCPKCIEEVRGQFFCTGCLPETKRGRAFSLSLYITLAILLLIFTIGHAAAENWRLAGGSTTGSNFSTVMNQGFYYQYVGNESNLTVFTSTGCGAMSTWWGVDNTCNIPTVGNRTDFSEYNTNKYLWMHPINNTHGALVKFIAPITAEYSFNASFYKTAGGNSVDWHINKDGTGGTQLYSVTLAGGGKSLNNNVTNLTVGENLVFYVTTPDSSAGDSSGLILNISSRVLASAPIVLNLTSPSSNINESYHKFCQEPWQSCDNIIYNSTYFEWNTSIPWYNYSNLMALGSYYANIITTTTANNISMSNLDLQIYINPGEYFGVQLLDENDTILYEINTTLTYSFSEFGSCPSFNVSLEPEGIDWNNNTVFHELVQSITWDGMIFNDTLNFNIYNVSEDTAYCEFIPSGSYNEFVVYNGSDASFNWSPDYVNVSDNIGFVLDNDYIYYAGGKRYRCYNNFGYSCEKTEDYYDFLDLTANVCVEDWMLSDTECISNLTTLDYYDFNLCGTFNDVPLDNGTLVACVTPGEFAFSDWQMYLYIIILVVLFLLGILYFSPILIVDGILIILYGLLLFSGMHDYYILIGMSLIGLFVLLIGIFKSTQY